MILRRVVTSLVLLVVVAGGTARAVEPSPVSQLRQVQSQSVDSTTGYTCISGGGGPPLPACPVDLGTTTLTDSHSAPDFLPLSETAATPGGQAFQTSSIASSLLSASGASSAQGSAGEISDPEYVLVLHTVAASTQDDFQVTFGLAETTGFVFEASGQIRYPDPGVPVPWDAALDVTLTGPGGEVASFVAHPDFGCVSDPDFTCTVVPAPVSVSGSLEPGSYTLSVQLVTSGGGTWLPSVGPLAGFAEGSYDASLQLVVVQTPTLTPAGYLLAVLSIALAGWAYDRRGEPASRVDSGA